MTDVRHALSFFHEDTYFELQERPLFVVVLPMNFCYVIKVHGYFSRPQAERRLQDVHTYR